MHLFEYPPLADTSRRSIYLYIYIRITCAVYLWLDWSYKICLHRRIHHKTVALIGYYIFVRWTIDDDSLGRLYTHATRRMQFSAYQTNTPNRHRSTKANSQLQTPPKKRIHTIQHTDTLKARHWTAKMQTAIMEIAFGLQHTHTHNDTRTKMF